MNPTPGAEPEPMARGDAGQAAEPFLLYRDGEGNERRFSLEAGLATVSVGRGPSPELALDWDQQVSRLHARLERAEGGWAVVDDGMSRHGTFVNGGRVSGRQCLSDGDILRIGATTMTFRFPAEQKQAAPAASGEGQTGVVLSTAQRRVLVAVSRPYKQGTVASPGTDEQIAEELFMPVQVVKTHLRVLYAKLGVDQLPADQKRAGLVERALGDGVITEQDL